MSSRQSLDRALELCLQDLARTGDAEDSLRRCPKHADQLRPLLGMAQAVQRCYDDIPAAPGGLRSGRECLLAAAAQQRARLSSATSEAGIPTTQTTRGRKTRFAPAMRLVRVLLAVVVGVAALGGGIAWAASDSLPGDLLYPAKAMAEDVHLALASVPKDQVDLALGFVDERVEEIQGLLEMGRHVPDETIARMEQHIQQALVSAARVSSDEEMVNVLGQIAMRTRTQVQTLERMQLTVSHQDRATLAQAVAICRQGAEAAKAGLGDPRAFRLRYRHPQRTPEPTSRPGMMTVTPGDNQKRHQECKQHKCTPTSTPHTMPHGPQETPRAPRTRPGPQPTSQKPRLTPELQSTPQKPKTTPHGSHMTPDPQTTPSGSQATSSPRSTTQGSQTTPKPRSSKKGP
jgi:hypothetical protein